MTIILSFFHNFLHLIGVIVLPICVKCAARFVETTEGLKTGFSLLAGIAFNFSLTRNHEKMCFVSMEDDEYKYDFVKW